MLQAYRPGGLAALGFGADRRRRLRPGIVYVSLSRVRPHRALVVTARLRLAGADGHRHQRRRGRRFRRRPAARPADADPRHGLGLPARLRRGGGAAAPAKEGGSWLVQVSLARTALWLRSLGRVENGFDGAAARLRRPHRDRRLGLRPARGDPAGHGLLGHARRLCATLGPAGQRRAGLGLNARSHVTESRPPSGSPRTLPIRP